MKSLNTRVRPARSPAGRVKESVRSPDGSIIESSHAHWIRAISMVEPGPIVVITP